MPLPQWALALADSAGKSGEHQAVLATVTSLPELDERALVVEAQAGNRAAFEELVRRFDRDVLRLALNLMKRPEDARDVYQEAFLKVYRNLHRFRFECSFYTWLYRIVTNVCLDHLRRRQARPEDQAPEVLINRQERAPATFSKFSASTARRSIRSAVLSAKRFVRGWPKPWTGSRRASAWSSR
jgi:DNA-directed RNA polymerase specialized sigma24 family protein